MTRYLFEIAYKGTAYHGWQLQKNSITVQEVVESALSTILRIKTSVTGSGRTDTGVHCLQQYFHVDFINPIDEIKMRYKLNSFLPKDISIGRIRAINIDGHARFSAISRSYEYRINTQKNPFLEEFSYYFNRSLNISNMNEAGTLLLGKHDFQAFSRVKTEVNNFVCEIIQAEWEKDNETIVFKITANRFLRGMVRAIVGTMLDIGTAKKDKQDMKEIIDSKDRKQAGRAAPAHGLFLTQVNYSQEIFKNA